MALLTDEIEDIEPTRENLEEFFPAQIIGPTWAVDDEGDFLLPERTLGWHVLAWIEENLTAFDGDGPFTPTPEQARFILWFYAINDDGRFTYPKAVLQRCKGWGKDPLAAVLCIVELIGPCLYWKTVDGFDLGRPNPVAYVGLGAVSIDQTGNTRDLFPALLPKRTIDKYNLDVQKEHIYVRGTAAKLKAFTTAARSMEGVRLTFFIANETHHWTVGYGGPNFYNTVTGNLSKVPYPNMGRLLAITNAYQPGEGSQAELTRTDQQKVWDGLKESDGMLYDSIEAHPSVPMTPDWAPLVLEQVRGDATWLSWENNKSDILRGDLPVSRKRRMWYNQVVSSEEAVFDLRDIEQCTDNTLRGNVHDLRPGDVITLGFDGGSTDDSTALVAYRLKDKLVVPIHIWEKPDGVDTWRLDQTRVDSVVHWVFQRFKVVAFYADVALWESYINAWSDVYRDVLRVRASAYSPIGFDMRGHRKKVALNNESFLSEVRDGMIRLNGDPVFRRHMLNAEARFDGFGLKFGKRGGRESPNKIDGLIAGTLAYMAARDISEKSKAPARRYRGTLM
ncbi:MAG: terminase [Gammaproteobacteria bacterium]|nr:terminase [Gammaproteobacteria bacterium]